MVRRIGVVALLAAAACSVPEQPIPVTVRELVVHAILDPSLRYQTVTLSMTSGAKIDPGELDSAVITLTTPDGTVLTARQDASRDTTRTDFPVNFPTNPTYRIDLQAAGVSLAGGGRYRLSVVTRAGSVVTAETTIPSATPVPLPALEPFQRLQDTVRLSWSPVAGAYGYEAQVWNESVIQVIEEHYAFYDTRRLRYTAFLDSALTLAGTARHFDDDVFFRENNSMVVVYAVDANYYAYYRAIGDLFAGAMPSRLEGGLGVFGSVVPIAQRRLAVK
jgi:hypothetical protein